MALFFQNVGGLDTVTAAGGGQTVFEPTIRIFAQDFSGNTQELFLDVTDTLQFSNGDIAGAFILGNIVTI